MLDEPSRDGLTQLKLWSNLPPEVTAEQNANLYRRHWRIEGLFERIESVLHGVIPMLGHPRAALLGFVTAVLAYNGLSLLKRCIEQAHSEQVPEHDVLTYHLAVDVVSDYKGLLIALPPEAWYSWSEASPVCTADYLLRFTITVVPDFVPVVSLAEVAQFGDAAQGSWQRWHDKIAAAPRRREQQPLHDCYKESAHIRPWP